MSSPEAAFAELVGEVLGGRYLLLRLVGRGGMGAVFEAAVGDERVAVKVVRATESDGSLTRFLREGKIASGLEHEHLVRVIDVGEDEPRALPFLVMPFLRGLDLGSLLETSAPLAPAVAARIAFEASEGLGFLHRSEVVHRDVKPSNLFLEKLSGGSVRVRVCDFGIARLTGALELTQLTNTGAIVGTPLYMAPEGTRGERGADARRDVYGMGATLYEMLTGAPAWEHLEGSALLVAIATKDPPSIREVAPWVDPALAAIVHRAMARDPGARPANGRELAELLRPHAKAALTSDALVRFAPDGDPLLGTKVEGRYRLLRLLGRGGMGSVYEAEDGTHGDHVAVKVIAGEVARTESRAIQRFLREADVVRSVESDNVVRTLETGTDTTLGSPFLVMELLHGIDLGTHIKDRGAIASGPAVRVFVEAARGIHAAHERGVIHRDIKPANLFLDVALDRTITVKVCDFGIAKQAPSEAAEVASYGLTQTGGMLGSPRYMSPEQAQDAKRVDRRSDVWSFCISLYETLSGRRAWEECTSLGEVIVAICTRPIKPLRDIAPWIDPALAAIVHRGLAIDPDQRWNDIAEIAAALTEHADDMPLTLDALRSVHPEHVATDSAVGAVDGVSVGDLGFSTHRTIERDAPRRKRRSWIAGGLAIVGACALVYLARKSPAPDPTPAPRPLASAVIPAEVPSSSHILLVSPADVAVTVDGHAVTSSGGRIVLAGRPGDAFEVALANGAGRTATRVFITSDRHLEPPRLVLETPPEPVASIAKRPLVPAIKAPVSASTPPPPPPPSALKPRETW